MNMLLSMNILLSLEALSIFALLCLIICCGALIRSSKGSRSSVSKKKSSKSSVAHRSSTRNAPRKVSRRKNAAFHKLGLSYSDKADSSHDGRSASLRSLKQTAFSAICSWTEEKCRGYFVQAGIIAESGPFHCWECKEPMVPSSRQLDCQHRCKNSACSRPRLNSPRFAGSPFWTRINWNEDAQYKNFLMVAFLFSSKVAADSAIALLQIPEGFVYNAYQQLRHATAWKLLYSSSRTSLGSGLVEVDSTKVWTKRKPTRKEIRATKAANKKVKANALALVHDKRVKLSVGVKRTIGKNKKTAAKTSLHKDRLLLAMNRRSKAFKLIPMADGISVAGAPSPPEGFLEIFLKLCPILDGKQHIVNSDAARALQLTFKTLAVGHTSAKHSADQFSPTVVLHKKMLEPKVIAVLSKLAKSKTPCCVETARSFQLAGGDNNCEGFFGRLKDQMRRTSGHRSAVRSSGNKSMLASLSAVFVWKYPGIDATISALAHYKEFAMKQPPRQV
eukprot:TRINITY_DN5630_c1_g1_i4.p1 TRINITY_DN5630_c1_g1~~TRINITY_DN5630_c1_g1_i4.p1  ORF type:complete len:503 (-),score=66.84 TRINITY_DN5630_c1_g1_i4:287-1795(-)